MSPATTAPRTVLVTLHSPQIPPDYPRQRYFNGVGGQSLSLKYLNAPELQVEVFRDATNPYTVLTIQFAYNGGVNAHLTAPELHTLAAALLSAAADLEAHPAQVLP